MENNYKFAADINKLYMRKIAEIFVIACIGTAFFACSGNHGKKNVIGVDQLGSLVEDMQDGDSLSVRGFCSDVCQSGAGHITLVGESEANAIAAIAGEKLVSFKDDVTYKYVTVNGILREQKVDRAFLDDWEYRLDESLKGPNGNPAAVAQLKEQIAALRDSIDARFARNGKEYYSNYTIEVYSYETEE